MQIKEMNQKRRDEKLAKKQESNVSVKREEKPVKAEPSIVREESEALWNDDAFLKDSPEVQPISTGIVQPDDVRPEQVPTRGEIPVSEDEWIKDN